MRILYHMNIYKDLRHVSETIISCETQDHLNGAINLLRAFKLKWKLEHTSTEINGLIKLITAKKITLSQLDFLI